MAEELERLVRQVVEELLAGGVKKVRVDDYPLTEDHRLDTGRGEARAYTRDLFTQEESPRLGAGRMEIRDSRFPWHLSYDEMDYVRKGRLDVTANGRTTSAGPGELIYLPKGSDVEFSAQGVCEFLYFVYPANWQEGKGSPL